MGYCRHKAVKAAEEYLQFRQRAAPEVIQRHEELCGLHDVAVRAARELHETGNEPGCRAVMATEAFWQGFLGFQTAELEAQVNSLQAQITELKAVAVLRDARMEVLERTVRLHRRQQHARADGAA